MVTNKNLQKQFVFPGAFSINECHKIINEPEFRENQGLAITNDRNYGEAKSYFFKHNDTTLWLRNRIMDYVRKVNQQYLRFRIDELKELQLLEYRENSFFNWHIELAGKLKSNSCRKINTLIFLSDPVDYQGGYLLFDLNNENQMLNQNIGDLIIFPSYQPHKVTKITSGLRYTLSAIVHGDAFR